MIVDGICVASNPASGREMSLATIRSTCFARAASRARARHGSPLSAAKPTSTGRGRAGAHASELREDVRCPHERQRRAGRRSSRSCRRRARPACSRRRRPPSPRRRRPRRTCQHGGVHLGRAAGPARASRPAGGSSVVGPDNEHHARAAARRLGGDGIAHRPARPVADDSGRGRCLRRSARRTRRRSRPSSGPVGRSSRVGRLDDLLRLGEPALADPAAGQKAVARARRTARRAPRASPGSAARPRARACCVFIAGAISTGARVAR